MLEGLDTSSTSPRRFDNLFEQTFVQTQKTALDAADLFNQGLIDCPLTTTTSQRFPGTYLGSQLRMVAQAIAARETYGHKRQSFFVSFGSWDHHDEVMDNQAEMLPDLPSYCLRSITQPKTWESRRT